MGQFSTGRNTLIKKVDINTMYLRDFVVSSYRGYPEKNEFDFSVGCVESLYFASLPKKVPTTEFAKIIIEPVELSQGKFSHQKMLDVIEVRSGFDFGAYWNASEKDRKLQILKLIQNSVAYLAETFGWDIRPFDEAYHRVIEKDFVHQFFLKKYKVVSPNKKLKAQIFVDFQVDEIKMHLVVTDKTGKELLRKLFVSVPPRNFFIMDAAGSLAWDGDEKVVIASRNKKGNWTIELAL